MCETVQNVFSFTTIYYLYYQTIVEQYYFQERNTGTKYSSQCLVYVTVMMIIKLMIIKLRGDTNKNEQHIIYASRYQLLMKHSFVEQFFS